jgi:hypothetical protein
MSTINTAWNPFMAPNPYFMSVLAAMPSGAAAYSQDLGQTIYNFSGQSLPSLFYPQFNPFGHWQGGIIPGLRQLGLG